jgi:hypothetical protein
VKNYDWNAMQTKIKINYYWISGSMSKNDKIKDNDIC